MSKEKLTKERWSKAIRTALKVLATKATEERGSIDEAAAATFLSRASIEKMKSRGSGSVESWIKLATYRSGLSASEVINLFEKLPDLLSHLQKQDQLDHLFAQLRQGYPDQELAAWMQLLLAKQKVEDFIGVTLKPKLISSSSLGVLPKVRPSSRSARVLKAAQPKRKGSK